MNESGTTTMKNYYYSERREATLFVLVGIAGLIFSLWCFFGQNNSFFTGMVIPLTTIALIQVIVGGTVYQRMNSQLRDWDKTMSVFQVDKEKKRMEVVMKNFSLYKTVEAVLVIAGFFLIIWFNRSNWWEGFGLALLLQATLMLVLDLWAERRGRNYLKGQALS